MTMDDYGFVYFLANTSMPGIYKIGFTTKHPRLRMAELASSSGCPTPFTLLAYFGAECPQRVESFLHRVFAEKRVNGRREFFSLEISDMSNALDHFAARYKDAVFRSGLDALSDDHKDIEEKPAETSHFIPTEEGRRAAKKAVNDARAMLKFGF